MNRSGRRPMEKPAESPSDGRPARKPNPRTMRLPGSVAEVQASPPGPEIGAFFNLDGILVAGFTASRLKTPPGAEKSGSANSSV